MAWSIRYGRAGSRGRRGSKGTRMHIFSGIISRPHSGRYIVVIAGKRVGKFPRTLQGYAEALRCLRNPPDPVVTELTDLSRVAEARAKLDKLIPDTTGRSHRMESFL